MEEVEGIDSKKDHYSVEKYCVICLISRRQVSSAEEHTERPLRAKNITVEAKRELYHTVGTTVESSQVLSMKNDGGPLPESKQNNGDPKANNHPVNTFVDLTSRCIRVFFAVWAVMFMAPEKLGR